MSDLTERLAGKLGEMYGFPERVSSTFTRGVAADAGLILPLLLSEPELVAGLAPEVKREVLRQLMGEERERNVALTEEHRARTLSGEMVPVDEWMPPMARVERIDSLLAALALGAR